MKKLIGFASALAAPFLLSAPASAQQTEHRFRLADRANATLCAPQDSSKLDSPFASFRLGIVVTPFRGIDGGLDVTFPRLGIARDWTARFDIDLAARFNSPSFGSRRDASVAANFCQVYSPGGVNRSRIFVGGGIGPYFGPRSGFGGKFFIGTNFNPTVSLQAEAQFPGDNSVRGIVMLRLSAL